MGRKRKKSNNYYTRIQDVAICAYNKSDSLAQREKIYRRFIYPPFMKLTENLINKITTQIIIMSDEEVEKINPLSTKNKLLLEKLKNQLM